MTEEISEKVEISFTCPFCKIECKEDDEVIFNPEMMGCAHKVCIEKDTTEDELKKDECD